MASSVPMISVGLCLACDNTSRSLNDDHMCILCMRDATLGRGVSPRLRSDTNRRELAVLLTIAEDKEKQLKTEWEKDVHDLATSGLARLEVCTASVS